METRNAKLIVNQSGGNASKGASTYRVTLPNVWVEKLGLGCDNKNLELCFNGESIIISKKPSIEEFVQKRKGNDLLKLEYYNFDNLCTVIIADYTENIIIIDNKTDEALYCAFGKNAIPSWRDYLDFLETRCVPKSRERIKDYLDAIGVNSYEPLEIIKKTNGKMAEDNQWIKVEEL